MNHTAFVYRRCNPLDAWAATILDTWAISLWLPRYRILPVGWGWVVAYGLCKFKYRDS